MMASRGGGRSEGGGGEGEERHVLMQDLREEEGGQADVRESVWSNWELKILT